MAINYFYQSRVLKELVIDEDEKGVFITMPSESEKGVFHIVRCIEDGRGMYVDRCDCTGYKYKRYCQHCTIVSEYWEGIYKKSSPAKEEKVVGLEVVDNKSEDWTKEAPLGGTRKYSLLR
ncbi:MAG TPA: hypothetical protein VHV10_05105 [Ktedonobacteraceae bacterium]|jgi:hypothetical protein|nr:hypothetical protein [Ktedonobacteraceae bacterium]